MAISVTTQDLENYPGIAKTVTVDITSLVPTGYEGDEQIVLRIYTTAYSDNTDRTAIQDVYVTAAKVGWCKSSGFTSYGSRFPLDSTHNQLKVKIDATVSGSDGSGYYTIALGHSDGALLNSEVVAADIETKIQALTMVPVDAGFQLAYKNCSVEYENGKFVIYSGTMGNSYTGINRSSVAVLPGASNDCSALLGFNLPLTSEYLASQSVRETFLTGPYTIGDSDLNIAAGLNPVIGEAYLVTNGTTIDYFTAISGTTGSLIKVPTSGVNGFNAITHNYTVAGSKVQRLTMQDPEGEPISLTSIDQMARFGLKYIINQVDYSS